MIQNMGVLGFYLCHLDFLSRHAAFHARSPELRHWKTAGPRVVGKVVQTAPRGDAIWQLTHLLDLFLWVELLGVI